MGIHILKKRELPLIGWCEWVALPELGITQIKAKTDTGARTSALHAFRVDTFVENNIQMVSFDIHPLQDYTKVITCKTRLYDTRLVTDSGGHTEDRFVIKTPLVLGNNSWPIEITLTNRDNMNFRMLLGRTALHKKVIVDPSHKFIISPKAGLFS